MTGWSICEQGSTGYARSALSLHKLLTLQAVQSLSLSHGETYKTVLEDMISGSQKLTLEWMLLHLNMDFSFTVKHERTEL